MWWKKKQDMERINYTSGAHWEDIVGYSRAMKVGNIIEVSGTVAVDEKNNVVGVNEPYEQTKYILNKIKTVLEKAGSGISDVVRTRMYVTDIARWEDVGRAHGEFFKDIKPASTMVEVKSLIHRDMMVEIEVTAVISKD